jgi:predicted regulator of Ras-like GTPase activity (Roadblock/LC7/MglB family)
MPRKFKQAALEQVLKKLCRQADCQAAAIASAADGLLVTSAGAEIETMAAVASKLPVWVGRLPRLDPVEEIMIRGHAGHQVVCRYFTSRGDALILIVVARAGVAYRQRVGEAVREIQAVWEGQRP